MESVKNNLKENFFHETYWQQLYVLSEKWKMDMLFYKDDLKFLHHLINKYFVWITKKESLKFVQDLENKLLELDKQCDSLLSRISTHLSRTANLIDDYFKYDSQKLKSEHLKLEEDFTGFVKKFRNNRKEAFKITEHIIESEELKERLSAKWPVNY